MRPVVAFAKIPLAPEALEDRLGHLLGGTTRGVDDDVGVGGRLVGVRDAGEAGIMPARALA
jgi:hypothetical protein